MVGAKDHGGFDASCKDDSDKYRPIRQPIEAEENNNMKVNELKHRKNDVVAADAVGIWESEPFYEGYNGELVRIARDVNAEFENHKILTN